MEGLSATAATFQGWLASRMQAATAILLVGGLSVVVISSLAALIFSGPLEPLLPIGLRGGLLGAILVNLAIGLVRRSAALVALPAAATSILLSILLTDTVRLLGDAPNEVLAATATLALVAASALTGLVFLAAGVFGLGELARYVPYPVFAGFLGAVGLLIVLGALQMAVPAAGAPSQTAAFYWLAALVLGIALLASTRIWRGRATLPLAIMGAMILFHAGRVALDLDLRAAAEMGLLLVLPDAANSGTSSLLDVPRYANVAALAAQWPAFCVLAVMAVLAAPLLASGIELSTGHELDIDRDLRTMGVGNLLAAAAGGGLVAYPNVGATLLLHRLLGMASGRAGLGVSLVLAAVLVGGVDLLAWLPRPLAAAVLVYVGLDMIDQWVLSARRRMPPTDFAILLGIAVVGVTVGLLEAVAFGLVAAVGLFIINYARLEFIRAALDGRLRQSTTERSEADRRRIIGAGEGLRIFELQGYVFFGAAQRLLRRLSAEIAAEGPPIRAIILDFRHTQGMDVSAAMALAGLAKRCAASGIRLWLTDIAAGVDAMILRADPAAHFLTAASLDAALASEEDTLLSQEAGLGPPSALAHLMTQIEAAGHGDLFARQTVARGTMVLRQGEPSDSLVLLEEGRMSARVILPDGRELHVATILSGALIGEIGFFGGFARTATVVSETDSVLRVARQQDLAELARRDPTLSDAFLRHGAALMAHRLARTSALLRQTYY